MSTSNRDLLMRAAVVGAGRIAQQHLGALTESKLANVVGVCDLSPATARCASERFGGIPWYTDFAVMLQEARPQVVHITTPPGSHYALSRDALDSRAHVIVEKPVTFQREELESLLEVADANHLCIVEDYNYLFSHTVQRLRQFVDQGILGSVIHVDVSICLDLLSQGSPFTDLNFPHWIHRVPGGVVADFVTHLSYLGHSFVGSMRSVQALFRKQSSKHCLKVDEFRATVDAEHGTANLSLSSNAQPDMFEVRLFGTRGSATAHLFEPRFSFELYQDSAKPIMPMRNCFRVARQSFSGGCRSLMRKLSGGPGSYDGLWELIRQTYSGLAGKQPMPIEHAQIREVNRWVQAILSEAPELSEPS
jgi:predicted dehydrogenase